MRKALSRIAAITGLATLFGSTPAPSGELKKINRAAMRGINPEGPKSRGFKYNRTPYAENGMSRHKQKMKCRIYCAPKKRKK